MDKGQAKVSWSTHHSNPESGILCTKGSINCRSCLETSNRALCCHSMCLGFLRTVIPKLSPVDEIPKLSPTDIVELARSTFPFDHPWIQPDLSSTWVDSMLKARPSTPEGNLCSLWRCLSQMPVEIQSTIYKLMGPCWIQSLTSIIDNVPVVIERLQTRNLLSSSVAMTTPQKDGLDYHCHDFTLGSVPEMVSYQTADYEGSKYLSGLCGMQIAPSSLNPTNLISTAQSGKVSAVKMSIDRSGILALAFLDEENHSIALLAEPTRNPRSEVWHMVRTLPQKGILLHGIADVM